MKYYMLWALLPLGLPAVAQNILRGNVTDQMTGESLPQVSVYLSDLRQGVVADVEGHYQLKNLPAGTFLVEVRYAGYQTVTQRVRVQGDTRLDFQLAEAVTELNQVVVTGATHATELREHPVPVAIIDQLALTRVSSTNLIDAIAKKPGLAQVTTGAGIAKPVIRGLGYNRIITLYNGLRQEGQQWGDEHGVEIDEFSVDRVEVLKGPGSLVYGSDALAGVVNFLTPNPLPEGQLRSGATLNYQTNNDLLATSLVTAGNRAGFNWLLRGTLKVAGNYRNRYDGRVWNSGFHERNFNGYCGWNKRWGFSQVHFSSFRQNLGLVEGDRDSLGGFLKLVPVGDTTVEEQSATTADLQRYGLYVPQQGIAHARLSNTTSLFLGKINLVFSLGWQQNTRKEYGDPLQEGVAQLFFLLRTGNYDVKVFLPEQSGWRTTIGMNGMLQSNRNRGEEALAPAYDLFDLGSYVVAERKFGPLHLSGGLRYDHRLLHMRPLYFDPNGNLTEQPTDDIKFAATQNSYAGASGSIGAAYNFNHRFTAKFNVARGFRAPNIAESGSNGRHEGTLRYEIGDSRLRPEYSLQTDLGLFFHSEHLTTEISLFYNRIDQYIFAKKLRSTLGGDSIVDPADPAPTFKFVQGDASLAGGEITFDLHPHPLDWLHFENSFSWVRGIQRQQPDSSRYLPFIPAARLRSELRGDFKKVGQRIANGFVFVEGSYIFDQNQYYAAFGTETGTPGYLLLNAGFGGQITGAKDREICKVFVIADNLLDTAYQSHLSRLKYAPANPATGRPGVFNMGRNVSVKVLVPLGRG